ncbi:MAG: peptide-methionine (S)-S-oxide reductase [Candidatus Harrisonbacteria bacterium CG10_big_fil_rev_8_21_14_0_10_40_38]|uniref:Peptide methionine sulfoxide reductase MsrA n=1 Tax=Candidatus Harrisonbacteria bacterium CG10_big_fil_rev_8_21_14_0_10_40_38 TaxID=1974583 RepID=A0A2H0USW2_9BACT|nr:MAG: peptide-methionine (S)-S-oxide reductase [Candidatus Harrisonbacteria bacterium CG10_big_fil_rev_8_21_14_0_10_40_38]
MNLEIAIFGGGCFWCTEAVFGELKGVHSVTSGYAGGHTENPTYEEVSSGKTGHAEVIRIEYDPAVISYRDLLTVFFATHDPTTLNQQGADVGTQYRSAIFYTTESQKEEAEKFIEELDASKEEEGDVVTEVRPLDHFYKAEGYHQEYYKNNSSKPYCQVVISPKLKKLKDRFTELLKEGRESSA